LSEYKNKYRIIIRSVSKKFTFQAVLFKKFMREYKSEEIEIIYMDDMSFEKILNMTDLFINFWVSTTFWETCFTRADIFLMDSSDLTESAKKDISARAFLYSELPQFINGLKKYMDEGIFYRKNNNAEFLKNYMDFDNRAYIKEHVDKEIELIIKDAKYEHRN